MSLQVVQVGRADRLCVLALPADMGVAEFCSFVGAYLPQIRDMRLVRREGGHTACMVLLRFTSSVSADDFYRTFNNKPVCCSMHLLLLYEVRAVRCCHMHSVLTGIIMICSSHPSSPSYSADFCL